MIYFPGNLKETNAISSRSSAARNISSVIFNSGEEMKMMKDEGVLRVHIEVFN